VPIDCGTWVLDQLADLPEAGELRAAQEAAR
jgi:hypothetical protein